MYKLIYDNGETRPYYTHRIIILNPNTANGERVFTYFVHTSGGPGSVTDLDGKYVDDTMEVMNFIYGLREDDRK